MGIEIMIRGQSAVAQVRFRTARRQRLLSVGDFRIIACSPDAPHDDAMTIQIAVRRLPHNTDLPLPAYATAGAAGMDLLAAVEAPVTIEPGKRALIPTGLAIACPPATSCRSVPARASRCAMASCCPTAPARSTRTTAARSR